MKYLGIDYGSKRVGIAVSDESARFALPKKVLNNSKKVFADGEILNEIKKLIAEHAVGAIVIGESKDFAGKDNTIMVEARELAEQLRSATGLSVFFEPEFMSSHQAARTDHELGGTTNERGGGAPMMDASAAAVILQSFLDRMNA
jgi:putative Holliday junction resolvase